MIDTRIIDLAEKVVSLKFPAEEYTSEKALLLEDAIESLETALILWKRRRPVIRIHGSFHEGNYIPLIKEVRRIAYCGLKEAKELVDAVSRRGEEADVQVIRGTVEEALRRLVNFGVSARVLPQPKKRTFVLEIHSDENGQWFLTSGDQDLCEQLKMISEAYCERICKAEHVSVECSPCSVKNLLNALDGMEQR